MTRKDYELIAGVMKRLTGDYVNNKQARIALKVCTEHLSVELAKDNPRFNAQKFKEAAGVSLMPVTLREAA